MQSMNNTHRSYNFRKTKNDCSFPNIPKTISDAGKTMSYVGKIISDIIQTTSDLFSPICNILKNIPLQKNPFSNHSSVTQHVTLLGLPFAISQENRLWRSEANRQSATVAFVFCSLFRSAVFVANCQLSVAFSNKNPRNRCRSQTSRISPSVFTSKFAEHFYFS